MSRERELLERAKYAAFKAGALALAEEIREYLDSEKQDQPEPVAWTSQEQLGYMEDPRYEGCGMYMWKLRGNGVVTIPLYLHPAPQSNFVRLSEEKMKRLINENLESLSFYEIARAIEDALEAKNK